MHMTPEQKFIHALRNQLGTILTSIEILQINISDKNQLAIIKKMSEALDKTIKLVNSHGKSE